MLEQFLDHIVAEDVCHELKCIGLDLVEDLFLLVTVGGLQLLLDEARAVLISAELYDVIVDVLNTLAFVGRDHKLQHTFNSYFLVDLPFDLNSSSSTLRTPTPTS